MELEEAAAEEQEQVQVEVEVEARAAVNPRLRPGVRRKEKPGALPDAVAGVEWGAHQVQVVVAATSATATCKIMAPAGHRLI